METPTAFTMGRMAPGDCADIWKQFEDTIETMRARRGTARLDALCMLSHTDTGTLHALMNIAAAVNELESSSSILMIRADIKERRRRRSPKNKPRTVTGDLQAHVAINPELDDEAADAIYRTILETALRPLLATPGTSITWNPNDAVAADVMRPHAGPSNAAMY